MAKDETVKPVRNVPRDTCSRCDIPDQVLGLIKAKVCKACVTYHGYHQARNHFGDPEYWTGRKIFFERGQNRINYMRATTNKPRDLLGGR